jgi:hypothetical protein
VQVSLSPAEVWVFLEGRKIAHHQRSYVPADVVLDPEHARLLKLARQARRSLAQGDVSIEVPDLAHYDALLGVAL